MKLQTITARPNSNYRLVGCLVLLFAPYLYLSLSFAKAEERFVMSDVREESANSVTRSVCLDDDPYEMSQEGFRKFDTEILLVMLEELKLSRAVTLRKMKKTQREIRKRGRQSQSENDRRSRKLRLRLSRLKAHLSEQRSSESSVMKELERIKTLCRSFSTMTTGSPTLTGVVNGQPVTPDTLSPCPAGSCLELTGENLAQGILLMVEILGGNGTARRTLFLTPTVLSSQSLRFPVVNFIPVTVRFTALAPFGVASENYASSNSLDVTFSDNAFDVHFQLDRYSGVAPLHVFADGRPAAGSGMEDDDFLNANYTFHFDSEGVDPSHPNPSERGFIAGHTFTEPGTYQVRAEVTDKAGNRAHSSFSTVTVIDPEVAFMPSGGGVTYCVTTPAAPGFGGCPTSDPTKHIITTNLQQALNLLGPQVRVLLSRNGAWNTANGLNISNKNGPWMLAAYPNPASASSQKPTIVSQNTVQWGRILAVNNSHDGRIFDLKLRGNSNLTWQGDNGPNISGMSIGQSSSRLLFGHFEISNTDLHAFDVGTGGALSLPSYIAFTDFLIRDFVQYGVYAVSDRIRFSDFVMTGSNDTNRRQHGIRIQDGFFNIFQRGVMTNLAASHTSITVRGNNSQTVISDCLLEKVVAIRPQHDQAPEFLSHIVYERNYHQPGPGEQYRNAGVEFVAKHVVARNNIFVNVNNALQAGSLPSVGGSEDIDFYHNTFYGSYYNPLNPESSQHVFLLLARLQHTQPSQAKRISFFNNVYYSASGTTYSNAIRTYAPLQELTAHDNIYFNSLQGSNWQVVETGQPHTFAQWQALGQDSGSHQVDPRFLSTNPADPTFLTLASDSPAVDSASSSGLDHDYFGQLRGLDGNGDGVSGSDCGALERQ